jgi:uncharacterized OB-fold protein
MGFEKFGNVGFVSETEASDFITNLEAGKVTVTRCKSCGTIFSPPQVKCSDCQANDIEWLELKGKGRLISYSTLYFAPSGFEDDLPYTLALAEFKEGVKIFGRLSKEIPQEEIAIGMELKLAPVHLPGDRISYQFEKA